MKYYARIASSLLLVCTAVAVLLAAIHLATRDQIAANTLRARQEAIAALYPAFSSMREESEGHPEGVHTVYTVEGVDGLLGYAVELASRGFGGDVQMIVGLGTDGAVCGVRILSHSETPGLGSRALEEGYLSAFHGMTAGGEIDGISGATFSSRAVQNGVALALSLGLGGEAA